VTADTYKYWKHEIIQMVTERRAVTQSLSLYLQTLYSVSCSLGDSFTCILHF